MPASKCIKIAAGTRSRKPVNRRMKPPVSIIKRLHRGFICSLLFFSWKCKRIFLSLLPKRLPSDPMSRAFRGIPIRAYTRQDTFPFRRGQYLAQKLVLYTVFFCQWDSNRKCVSCVIYECAPFIGKVLHFPLCTPVLYCTSCTPVLYCIGRSSSWTRYSLCLWCFGVNVAITNSGHNSEGKEDRIDVVPLVTFCLIATICHVL